MMKRMFGRVAAPQAVEALNRISRTTVRTGSVKWAAKDMARGSK
jgi:hypothetical protein